MRLEFTGILKPEYIHVQNSERNTLVWEFEIAQLILFVYKFLYLFSVIFIFIIIVVFFNNRNEVKLSIYGLLPQVYVCYIYRYYFI